MRDHLLRRRNAHGRESASGVVELVWEDANATLCQGGPAERMLKGDGTVLRCYVGKEQATRVGLCGFLLVCLVWVSFCSDSQLSASSGSNRSMSFDMLQHLERHQNNSVHLPFNTFAIQRADHKTRVYGSADDAAARTDNALYQASFLSQGQTPDFQLRATDFSDGRIIVSQHEAVISSCQGPPCSTQPHQTGSSLLSWWN